MNRPASAAPVQSVSGAAAAASHRLSIIIPAFNEERSIAALLERVLGEIDRLAGGNPAAGRAEVVVVNDGSTDATAEIVSRYPVTLLNLHTNRGYGAALQAGFAGARGDYLAFLDADGTYPPEHLTRLFEVLLAEEADMVVGSRMMGERSQMPVIRKLGNWLFARLIGWIGRDRITDGGSGMRVFKRAILPRLLPLSEGLDFIVAMSARTLHEDLRVREVPIPYDERVGASKLRVLADGVRFVRTILKVALTYNPLQFFVTAGAVLILWAAYLSLPPVWYYLEFRRVEDWEIYRLFTVMVLLVSGVETVYFGLLATRILNITGAVRPRDERLVGPAVRFLLARRVFRWSVAAGGALMAAAAGLNYGTIYQYVLTGKIYIHWSYLFAGATLFLLGVQLIMGGALSKILEDVRERERLRAQWRLGGGPLARP